MSDLERKNIENKIAKLEVEKEGCKGTKCEVYTRVTGYIRPVAQFNPGKKEEVKMRRAMKMQPCNCNK